MSLSKLSATLLLGMSGWAFAAAAQAEPLHLTILHYNDMDRMEAENGRGGFAKLMAVLKDEVSRGDRTVLLTHGGDAISPSLLSGFDHGAHIIDLINETPTAIFVPGNHEFDFGPEVAKQRLSEAKFPVVASNVLENGRIIEGAVETYTMDVGDITLGFIGLTTPDTVHLASADGVEFAPVLETTARLAEKLRKDGADLVIALAHVDIGDDMDLIRQGAVDVILAGHDHNLMTFYDGKTAFVESSSQANYVTALDLTIEQVDDEIVWSPAFRTLDTAAYEPDPEMAAKVQQYLDRLSAELDIEIGKTETALDSRRATVRSGEAAIGNLIADAIREAVGADIAITNGGGIRADREYAPGTVLTRRDIQSELPFGNKTVKLEVTGRQIREALEIGFSQAEENAGRFPHVSGMTVTVDLSQPPMNRVKEILVGGVPLDDGKTYTLATNDYMAEGGDGYSALVGSPNLIDPAAANFMSSQVIDYIERHGTVAPKVEGRIVMQ